MSKSKQCKGKTRDSNRCKNKADESGFCYLHEPSDQDRPYGMTLKMKRFAEYFVESGNGVASAELAGYSGSYSTLGSIASENLQKPEIQKYISDLTAEEGMGAREVLHRLANIARTSITDVVDIDPETNTINIDREKLLLNGSVVKKITIDKSTNPETGYENEKIRVELYPADQALVNLGRHHKLFTDVLETDDKNWLVPVDSEKVDAMDPLDWVEKYKPKKNGEDHGNPKDN